MAALEGAFRSCHWFTDEDCGYYSIHSATVPNIADHTAVHLTAAGYVVLPRAALVEAIDRALWESRSGGLSISGVLNDNIEAHRLLGLDNNPPK